MSEFFHMGGYAVYVWSAYGIAVLVLIANLLQPMLDNKQLRKRLQRMHQQEQD